MSDHYNHMNPRNPECVSAGEYKTVHKIQTEISPGQ